VFWDDEVDVLCVGSGAGGLAGAIAAVLAGATVRVAAGQSGRWPAPVDDPETAAYLDALTADVTAPDPAGLDPAGDAPFLTVAEAPTPTRRNPLPTFFGAHLREWNARCLSSPYGLLYTRVTPRPGTAMRAADGRSLDVIDLGAFSGAFTVDGDLAGWIGERARELDITVDPDTVLDRIVFEDGEVLGAELRTPTGPLAVRCRHGLAIAPAGPQQSAPAIGAGSRACLVGQAASRFARLELLDITAAP
jgi:hypothetical protein